jgi:glycosyltransferase involved in cell wall biosynthesis
MLSRRKGRTLTQNYQILKNKISYIRYLCRGFRKGISITLSGIPDHGIHISYGHERIPEYDEIANGGMIKIQRLNEVLPHRPRHFNILYMVSSNSPPDAAQLCAIARFKKAKFVWNQNGVAYPAWMPSGWEEKNAKMKRFLHKADYVFFQSEYAQSCADQYLGKRSGPSEILYNAVDTKIFSPAPKKNTERKLTLLVIGSQYQSYRLESAIRALKIIRKDRNQTRMVVAGKVWDHVMVSARQLIGDLRLENAIEFVPPFIQRNAVEIFNRGDILLHTKVQDVCPGVVIEAMASGLPIVYSSSGGVPELVDQYGGVGVQTKCSWEKRTPPAPELWAEAVLKVAENISGYSEAARQRAVERYDLQPWIERHKQIFSKLLSN